MGYADCPRCGVRYPNGATGCLHCGAAISHGGAAISHGAATISEQTERLPFALSISLAVTVPRPAWTVTLDDGRRLPLDRPAVLGRDPVALPGEYGVQLLAIPDETRTVSKTHVKLEPAADSVLVTDRHSTNGVVVITAGVATRCRAGEPMVAGPGSVVRFGDREMQVRWG